MGVDKMDVAGGWRFVIIFSDFQIQVISKFP